MDVVVRRWAAWAPHLHTVEDWRAWADAPAPLGDDETADAKFLPAMLRRRCTPLTRAMLTAAFGCVTEADQSSVRTVFASRHGSINESVELLENVARGERLSPSKFTHTVHNAQSGLFSIAAGNRMATAALAGRAETFGTGFLEALTHLHRDPATPVLYVCGDVPLADTFAPLVAEPRAAYAVGLLLAAPGSGAGLAPADGVEDGVVRLRFTLETDDKAPADAPCLAEAAQAERGWPDAAEFLRWLLSGGPDSLSLPGNGRRWIWRGGGGGGGGGSKRAVVFGWGGRCLGGGGGGGRGSLPPPPPPPGPDNAADGVRAEAA